MRSRKLLMRGTFIVFMLVLLNLNMPLVRARSNQATSPALKLVWQTKFDGDAVLVTPGDIGVDQRGNVYVSTQGSNSVKKFDSNRNFVMQLADGRQAPTN